MNPKPRMQHTRAKSTDLLSPSTAGWTSRQRLASITLGLFGVLVLYLLWVALLLNLDSYDGFELLLNGRTIARGGFFYSFSRAPLMAGVYAVVEATIGRMPVDLAGFRAAHVVAVAFYAMFCGCVYKLMRLHLEPAMSMAAATALAFNGLLIHYSPMFKEDIPGALLTAAAFHFYLRAGKPGRLPDLLVCGLMMGLAGATKYNVLPLLLAVLGTYELIGRRSWWKGRWTPLIRGTTLLVVPVAIMGFAASLVFCRVGHSTFWGGPRQFIVDLLDQTQSHLSPIGSASDGAHLSSGILAWFLAPGAGLGYRFVFWSLSPAITACALAGIAVACKARRPGTLFHLLWAGFFFVVHTHVVNWREARYYFPMYPPLYFFAAIGAWAIVGHIVRRVPEAYRTAVASVVGAGLLVHPAINAAAECRRFTDPVYTVNFEREVSETAAQMAGAHKVFWVGRYYAIHPKDYIFHPDDPYTSLYHFWVHVVLYYVNRGIFLESAPGPSAAVSVFSDPQRFGIVRDGDVFIFNPEPASYHTSTVPADLQPLIVTRVRGMHTEQSEQTHSEWSMSPSDATGPVVNVRPRDDGWEIHGARCIAPWVVICVNSEDVNAKPVLAAVQSDGTFTMRVSKSEFPGGGQLKSIEMRWLESPTAFTLPTR